MRDIASERHDKARRHTSANRCANDAIERLSTPRAMIMVLCYMLFFDTVQETHRARAAQTKFSAHSLDNFALNKRH